MPPTRPAVPGLCLPALLRKAASHGALLLVLVLCLGVDLACVRAHPVTLAWGDERAYVEHSHAHLDARREPWRLLPGFMPLEWQPPLVDVVYSFLSYGPLRERYAAGDEVEPTLRWDDDLAVFFQRAERLNFVLLVVASVLLYALGLAAGLARWSSALATACFALNPRVLFYVQGLWPEMLHFVLLFAHLLAFLAFLRRGSAAALLCASTLLAYCALTKGLAGPWFAIAFLFLAVRLRGERAGWRRTLLCLALFALPYLGLTGAQKARNLAVEGTFGIATNTWVNVEAGLRGRNATFADYWRASRDPVERERASRERVRAYLEATPLATVATRQLRSYRQLLLEQSFLQLGLEYGRWRGDPDRAQPLLDLSVALSWCLFVLGAAGALVLGATSAARAALACFLAWYLASLALVCSNPRFFVQAIPLLALFAALLVESAVRGRRRAPTASAAGA